ncbi:MAG: ABC transporter ATP-binding protein [Pyrinomonadaceae bacterium]|nr:ABC transporter ATP-binding protein [Phycisphaerales bacterium]
MLKISELRKSFGTLVAVDGMSFEIARGEVFGLLGPNGAGKSTTINMAIGVLTPDSGSVEIEGVGPPTRKDARRLIGFAPQSLALYDELSGRENIEFFGRLQGLSGVRLHERAQAVLDAVGLTDRAKDKTGTYSGGMKRRLNLAAALVHDPQIVLLDEPTAGVDPQSRNNIIEMVQTLANAGKTIVYTTHYMEEAAKLCDRVGIMDKGQILAIGRVDDLVSRFGGESVVTIRRGDTEDVQRTADPVAVIQHAMTGGDVSGVRIDRPDLEMVFLSLTGRTLRD